MPDNHEHFDCLIIGASISGIDAAYHLKKYCNWAKYAILERRSNLGGTWDLMKYPGIRSDSDMYTYGFSWKIWKSAKPISIGEDILAYLTEAAKEQGIIEKIMFDTDVRKAEWLSKDSCWYLTTSKGTQFSCNMLFGCTGYYSYENPYRPIFPGENNFSGPIIHPQQWNDEADNQIIDKKVAIIGSGATAVTILPNISHKTKHVTMIQRTPTYIVAIPEVDPLANFLLKWLPQNLALVLNRWKAVLYGAYFFQFCKMFPERSKKLIKKAMWEAVKGGMSKEDFHKNFTPPYNPWDQRLCLTPGADFFDSIKEGKASVVTGHIEQLTDRGVELKGGKFVEADLIISATGLTLQQNFPFSTMEVTIDGDLYKAPDKMIYKGVMLSDVPNFSFIMGYTNASWTLKADIACIYFTKLLNYMKKNNFGTVCPRVTEGYHHEGSSSLGLTSGYVSRAANVMPKEGNKHPWKLRMNYILDLVSLWWNGIEDKEGLKFFPK